MNAPPKPLEKFIPNPKLKLREQLAEVMRFKHFSHRTESAYWCWIRGFIFFHQKRHPREMGAAEVQAYLSHLASERDVAPATQNQALNAHTISLAPGFSRVEAGGVRANRFNGLSRMAGGVVSKKPLKRLAFVLLPPHPAEAGC